MNRLGNEALPVLTFVVGEGAYALPIDDVVEVGAMVEITVIPESQPELLGVANRHGKLLPMLDLRRVFQCVETPITAATLFIVTAREGQHQGLVVDDVEQVDYIDPMALQSGTLTGKYIRGIINHRNRLIHMIALDALWRAYQADQVAG